MIYIVVMDHYKTKFISLDHKSGKLYWVSDVKEAHIFCKINLNYLSVQNKELIKNTCIEGKNIPASETSVLYLGDIHIEQYCTRNNISSLENLPIPFIDDLGKNVDIISIGISSNKKRKIILPSF